jgi:hypothetical protein
MSLTVSQGNSLEFETVPEGTYIGRCYKIVDLGTQTSEWAGEKKQQKKVMVSWELLDPEVKMQDGRPFAVHQRYTASLGEKANLRKDLEAWRGKKFTDVELEGFELKNVLGAYCMIQVVHTEKNGSTYANVNAIMSTKEKPNPVNEDVIFDIDSPDLAVFDSLSERMKELIQATPEWQSRTSAGPEEVVTDVPESDEEFLVNISKGLDAAK